MSIVTHDNHPRVVDHCTVKCTHCGGFLHPPYLRWDGYGVKGTDILICRHCAPKLRRGFTADLIQLAANQDMIAAGVVCTLVRT